MSRTVSAFLVVLLCAAVFLSGAAQSLRTVNGTFDYDKASQVVTNLNRLRQANSLRPLKMETALTEAAMLRAAELAFRAEEERDGESSAENGKRPGGGKNIQLIAEQYHVAQMNGACQYAHLSGKPFIDIGTVVKSLKAGSSSALFSATYNVVGCGSFLSSEGVYYWVLYLMPGGNGKCEIPSGQLAVEVSVALKSGEKTGTMTRTKSNTDLTPTGFEVTGHFNYEKAIKVVELTNKERSAKGLKSYIMDSTLMELAMLRAVEMKGIRKMTHTRPNGERGIHIVFDTWEYVLAVGENIAYGQGTAEEVVRQWMNSPGHRSNMLDADCTRMGAGECDGYWVQLFVKSRDKTPVLSRSAARIDEVTVQVTIVSDGKSKVVRRKRVG